MRKVRLLTFALLLFVATAAQASKVAWIDGGGWPIHIWNISDGSNTLWAFRSYYACIQQVAILEARNKQH